MKAAIGAPTKRPSATGGEERGQHTLRNQLHPSLPTPAKKEMKIEAGARTQAG